MIRLAGMNETLAPFKDGAEAAVCFFGSHLALAKTLGYDDLRNVSAWANGLRPFPPEHCTTIERESSGQVTRQELRPHDFWKIWPDLAHLAPQEAKAPA